MDSAPLADRSPNTHLPVSHDQNQTSDLKTAATKTDMTSSLDYHRQVVQGKLGNQDKHQASYVSPSDDIMSPCSKKLSDLKGKRFKNVGKPQSLFAKLGKKSFEQHNKTTEEGEKTA